MVDPSAHRLFAQQIRVHYSLTDYEWFGAEDDSNINNAKLQFDTKHPEKHVDDVNESEQFVIFNKILPYSCQTPMEANPFKQMMAHKAKLYHTERRLRSIRKKKDTIRKDMEKEWNDLEEKEKKLRANFILFSKFVEENHEKRTRANKKIEDDKKQTAQRQEEIDQLVFQMKEMESLIAFMERTVKKLKPIKDFLQAAVDMSKEFDCISDVIDRYQNLRLARKELLRRQQRNINALEHSKCDMMKLIEEKNFVIMGLNNQIANLQARYENANIKALESEELVTQIKNNAVKQLGEIDTVKNSIWNVYVHMASSKKHPIKIKKDNVEEQMMYINRTLTELSKVNKLINKKASKLTK